MKLDELLRNKGALPKEEVPSEDKLLTVQMFKNWRTLPKHVWAFCTNFEVDKETGVPYRYSALVKMVRRNSTTSLLWHSFEEVYEASEEKIAVPSSSPGAASLIAAIHGIQAFDFGSSRLTRKALQNAIEL